MLMFADDEHEGTPREKLKVIGVGGAGGNAVNNMIMAGLKHVEFVAVNTDSRALDMNQSPVKMQLGSGRGAGGKPEEGQRLAEESSSRIEEVLRDSDMVFITAGMGGGTGTGAAPVIARMAREQNILTVGVVTKPFDFEGRTRLKIAQQGIEDLKHNVDSLIVVPNQRLLNIVGKNTSIKEAFRMADDVLLYAVRGIADLINVGGLIDADFNDVRTIMSERGMALMGMGNAAGDERATDAAHAAISNPLLDEVHIDGARGILINISAGSSLTPHEVASASKLITETAHEEANIKVGLVIDESYEDKIQITVIATGFESFHREMKAHPPKLSSIDMSRRPQKPAEIPITPAGKSGQKQSFIEPLKKPAKLQNPFSENSEDEYDVPTYLRKQMD